MIKSAIIILCSSFVIGFSAFSVNSLELFSIHSPEHIQIQESVQDQLETHVEFKTKSNKILTKENILLKERIAILEDSIVVLKDEIFKLQSIIAVSELKIDNVNVSMTQINEEYGSLKAQISKLYHQNQIDKVMIDKLEADKAEMRKELNNLQLEKLKQQRTIASTEQQLAKRRQLEQKHLQLASILNHTQIKFQKVTPQDQLYTDTVKRMAKKEKNWNVTLVEFFIENENIGNLLDREFIAKIVDADTYQVIPHMSTNGLITETASSTQGKSFTFDGNMVELVYFNDKLKRGRNYEIHIFYKDEYGKEFPLMNGVFGFIQNRKLIKPV